MYRVRVVIERQRSQADGSLAYEELSDAIVVDAIPESLGDHIAQAIERRDILIGFGPKGNSHGIEAQG